MTTTQLRAELFREMSPLLDSEKAMKEILMFVRTLNPAKKEKVTVTPKAYKEMLLSPEIKKWNGCASFSEKEIDSDPKLKAILSK